MSYPLRTTGLHGLLFLVVTVSFILPVVFGTGALLPVPAAVVLSVLSGGAALVDASYHAFSPAQRPTRGCALSPRWARLRSSRAGWCGSRFFTPSTWPAPHPTASARFFSRWARCSASLASLSRSRTGARARYRTASA